MFQWDCEVSITHPQFTNYRHSGNVVDLPRWSSIKNFFRLNKHKVLVIDCVVSSLLGSLVSMNAKRSAATVFSQYCFN